MNIIITGTSSGVGEYLASKLQENHTVVAINRNDCDLNNSIPSNFVGYCDMLINCAGTGIGGKIDFVNHNPEDINEIFNVNLLAPIELTRQALKQNKHCKIVNITSTNNKRYYPNDLAYSLSKLALSEFGKMLAIEYPEVKILEVRLGLTQTNFNSNRYKKEPDRFQEIYHNKHLTIPEAGDAIIEALFNDNIKFIEVSP
jgi:short-subunit dehydrogenase